jgi:hypothetical protein
MSHVPPNVRNVAKDDAHVDAQIGYVIGDVKIYSVPSGDPRKKFETGRNYLQGDNPRQAERLIEEAAMGGHRSTEVAYYWVLAILSDRSFDHLGQEEFRRLRSATTMAREFPHDQWREALDVVIELVDRLDEETGGPSDARSLEKTLDRFRSLPQERRDEIHRHLDMVVNGWIKDRISAQQEEYVLRRRFENNREQRVWKFFEPVPEAPRRLDPPRPTPNPGRQGRTTAGYLLGATALCAILLTMLASPPLLLLTLVVGGLWAWLVLPRALSRRSVSTPVYPVAGNEAFADAVSAAVEHWFEEEGPQDPAGRRRWLADSEPLRERLKEELTFLYGDLPRVGPIQWLIRWHARTAAERYRAGGIPRPLHERPIPAPLRFVRDVLLKGWMPYAAFFGVFLGSLQVWPGVFLFWILLVTGAAMCWSDLLDHLVARQRYRHDRAAAEQRFAEETREYERWCAVLADRPEDTEIATWLDYDKLTFKSWALREYGLSNSGVVAQLLLTEAAPNCRRARVPYGPPRYSSYVLLLFLLTEGGVRQVSATLDLATGRFYNQRRDTFRYDMIASVRVEEVGVRIDAGHRRVLGREEIGRSSPRDLDLQRAFRLSLVNNQHVDVLVDGFQEGTFERLPEDKAFLEELAMNTSGVSEALRILEAVSAEGREWLALERARRRRRLQDFRASQGIPDGLGSLSGERPQEARG